LSFAAIVQEPIDPAHVLSLIGADRDGASILFLGVVRDHNDGRSVGGVRYDAYDEMATRVLSEIVEEAARSADTDRIAAVHRVGDLKVGEVSVAIAVSSPHRAEAYDASRYIIEEIKKRLPVWKKERYSDGAEQWVKGNKPDPTPAPKAPQADGS
jgi:molybdopterin synthase catalytic subunit